MSSTKQQSWGQLQLTLEGRLRQRNWRLHRSLSPERAARPGPAPSEPWLITGLPWKGDWNCLTPSQDLNSEGMAPPVQLCSEGEAPLTLATFRKRAKSRGCTPRRPGSPLAGRRQKLLRALPALPLEVSCQHLGCTTRIGRRRNRQT
jgi:hypothetical protein